MSPSHRFSDSTHGRSSDRSGESWAGLAEWRSGSSRPHRVRARRGAATGKAVVTSAWVEEAARTMQAARSENSLRLLRQVVNAIQGQTCRAIIGGTTLTFTTLGDKLDALLEAWEDYTSGRSVIKYDHSVYTQVIGVGPPAVPVLLERLCDGDTDWVYALTCITGEQPDGPETDGDPDAVVDAWVQWGRRNGYFAAEGHSSQDEAVR